MRAVSSPVHRSAIPGISIVYSQTASSHDTGARVSEHNRDVQVLEFAANGEISCGSAFAPRECRMKSASGFQNWSVARVARAVIVIVSVALLLVVTASLFERPAPEPKSSQGTERKQAPGLPDRHHRTDVLA